MMLACSCVLYIMCPVEFDSPHALLSKPAGPTAVFASMVEQTGEINAQLIRDCAAAAHAHAGKHTPH